MTNSAWVFPGQGSQAVNMGVDLLETAIATERYRQAEAILGWSVLELCQGDLEILSQTQFTQPCLYVISAILADLLHDKGLEPGLVAGHSLGEYAALYTAGAIAFEDGVSLVKQRAELMAQASDGKMMALMGFDREQLLEQLQATPDAVLANDNHDGQVVISGSPAAVDQVVENIKVKRTVPLKVSGAFHSPLMATAAAEFNAALAQIDFKPAQVRVVSNVDPTPTMNPDLLKARLMAQMTGPVRWREISLLFNQIGVSEVVEVGPGKVLTGLVKRTCPDVALVNVGTLAAISGLVA